MTIRQPVVVIGSSNGSRNYGDDMMWLATTNALRASLPEVPVITDASPGWLPPLGAVEVLPFMHDALLRAHMTVTRSRLLNKAQAALALATNRGALSRGLTRQEELANGASTQGIERPWEEAIARSQAMIISGAGGLTDAFALHAVAGWGMMIALAHRHAVPVVMLGQGVGPLYDMDCRAALAASLARCELVTTRERMSERLVRELAPCTPVTTTIDWAIAESPSATAQKAVDGHLVEHGVNNFVAVSLHDWRPAEDAGRQQVAGLMGTIVQAAADEGCDVVLVPNCVGVQRADDRVFMRKAVATLPRDLQSRVISLPGDMTAFETRALLTRAKGVFASRYHPVVFALAAGTPATGICYDDYYVQKHAGALSWYGEASRLHVRAAQHSLDWWRAGIDLSGSSRSRRLDITQHLRQECLHPLEHWLKVKELA